MKLKSCITVAFREFIHSLKTFALYFIILVCLESISITMLRAATDTPDKIADIADELGYNYIFIDCNRIDELDDLFKESDFAIHTVRSDMAPGLLFDFFDCNSSSDLKLLNNSEGVICHSEKFENKSISYLLENMISGDRDIDKTGDFIWISDEVSEKLKVSTGDTLTYEISEQDLFTFEVAGVYKANKDISSSFIAETTYDKLRNSTSYSDEDKFDLLIKCNDFKKIGTIKEKLTKNDFSFSYADQMYSAVNMMYSSFYASVVILTVALTGIVIYLSELYFNKRRSFFSVNYIIGMSQKNIVQIIFILLTILITFSLLFSSFICMLIMGYFDNYLLGLFDIDFELHGFPLTQFIIYCLIMCICLLIILVRIKKLIKKTFASSSGRNL